MTTKVLLVEDDPSWLKIFYILVGDATKGIFDYTHVTSLGEALAAIEKGQFELILLDLMLPDSHAINTVKIMTDKVKHIPIIVITTIDDEKLMAEAFRLGAEDYLVKDQYELKTFIHVSRQAIRRFIGKWTNPLQQSLEKIIENLQSLDNKLKDFQ